MVGACNQSVNLGIERVDGRAFDFAEFSEESGLSPTSVRHVGDALPFGRTSRRAVWTLALGEHETYDTNVVIMNALALLESTGKRLADALTKLTLQGILSVKVHYSIDQPTDIDFAPSYVSVVLTPEVISRLYDSGLHLGIDQSGP